MAIKWTPECIHATVRNGVILVFPTSLPLLPHIYSPAYDLYFSHKDLIILSQGKKRNYVCAGAQSSPQPQARTAPLSPAQGPPQAGAVPLLLSIRCFVCLGAHGENAS